MPWLRPPGAPAHRRAAPLGSPDLAAQRRGEARAPGGDVDEGLGACTAPRGAVAGWEVGWEEIGWRLEVWE